MAEHNPYYKGDLEADLRSVQKEPFAPILDNIGDQIGYGRAQQILQILWAKKLVDSGIPAMGALLPEPVEKENK